MSAILKDINNVSSTKKTTIMSALLKDNNNVSPPKRQQ